jgi:hypothetical protein
MPALALVTLVVHDYDEAEGEYPNLRWRAPAADG